MPFHVGTSHCKIENRSQIKNTDIIQTKHNPEKQTTQNTAKQSYLGSVAFYDTQPVNEKGLYYNSSEFRVHTERGNTITNIAVNIATRERIACFCVQSVLGS